MKKNLFKITEQEKKEILEKHISLKESSKYNVDINLLFEQKPTTGGKPTSGGKPTGGGTQTVLPTWTTNYPCLLDRGTIKKTTVDNQVKYQSSDGDNEFFFKSFYYQFNGKDGKKIRGTWECKNGALFIKRDDGKQWQKSTGWVDQPRTNSGNTIKRSKYTKCPETVVPPLKQWCKNETIRKVQACLKMPKRFLTGNFGQNTQEYLESRGQNGTLITPETIVNVCGANHPLVKDLGISVPGVENKTGIGATGGETTAPGATVGVSKPDVPLIPSKPEVPLSPSKPESKTGSEIEINPNEY
jgi:hypothetical protein